MKNKINKKLMQCVVLTEDEYVVLKSLSISTSISMSKIVGNLIRNANINTLQKNLKKDLVNGFHTTKSEISNTPTTRIVKKNKQNIMSKTGKRKKKTT
jgi:hypothetical protein